MLVKISEDENHNKIVKPIAGATLGQGVPLGAWCSFEKDVAPSNNWLMAGTTFDATKYPALNLYLGTNKVPSRYDHNRPSEWEEVVATTSTVTPVTAQYDGLITVTVLTNQGRYITVNGVNYNRFSGADTNTSNTVEVKKGDVVSVSGSVSSYYVSACWYKHPLFIKATSIASDSDKDSILAQIQEYNTYSTEETLTGKTWIDGKPIYRKVYTFTSPLINVDATNLNINEVIKIEGGGYATGSGQTGDEWVPIGFTTHTGDVYVSVDYNKSTKKFSYIGWRSIIDGYYIFEYTKTTD